MTTSVATTASSPNLLTATENLWERAAVRLREKDKVLIVSNTAVSLKDILSTVEAERSACESNRLVVKRGPDKDPIVLREVFSNIAGWIEKFVAVGDTAMQYDTGHAALPWAAVRLVLQISIQDVRRYAAVLDGIENVSKIIAYCRIMESIYFRTQMKTTEQAKNAMVDLYASILSFLAKTRRYFAKNSLRRTLGSIIDFDNKFQYLLKGIGEKQSNIQQYSALMDAEYQKDIQHNFEAMNLEQKQDDQRLRALLSDIQRPIDRIEKRLQTYEDGLQATARLQIMNWLSSIPYMQHHIQVQSDVLSGTGQWLLEDNRFLGWQDSKSSSVLWLHGIPGSGKSRLVSILIEHLLKSFNEGNGPHPAFFYCTRNPAERERASPEAILRSLVRQLSCHRPGQSIDGATRELYNERTEDGLAAGPLSLKESVSLLIHLTGKRRSSHIVIDALDECDRREREYLLDALSQIAGDSTGMVKIFISSRDDMDIVRYLAGCLNVQISAKSNQDDIATFVHVEVDKQIKKKRLLSGQVSDTLRHKIKRVLCDQAQGMFRWVSLQLQYLCTIKVASLVEQRLGKLPQDLRRIYHETYNERLYEYQEEETAITQSALRWLICSQKPLDTETFLSLTSSSAYQRPTVRLTRDDLLDLCFNFIVHDVELDRFRFAHLSVREYLESLEFYQFESSHAFAAEYCLKSLTLRLDSTPKISSDRGNLARPGVSGVDRYVCTYWPHHLKQSGEHRYVGSLKTIFSAFTMEQQNASHFSDWNKKTSELQIKSSGTYGYRREDYVISFPADVLFVACVWEFEDLLKWRINEDSRSLDVHNKKDMTALHITCRLGNIKAARMLLEEGVDLGATWNNQTALRVALFNDFTALAQLLIEKGANRSTDLYDVIQVGSTAMACIILDLGAYPHEDVPFSDEVCCVFHLAVEMGQEPVVERMLEKIHADEFEKKEWLARTKVMAALERKADITALFQQDKFGSLMDQETLHAALWKSAFLKPGRRIEVARTLINARADVNLERPLGDHNWWKRKHNLPVGRRDSGKFLLQEKIRSSTDIALIELLLDSGALTDPPVSRWQKSPLETAVRWNQEAHVLVLMNRGARIDGTDFVLATGPADCFLGSLLDLAESEGHVAIARLLSQRGVPSAVRRLAMKEDKQFRGKRDIECYERSLKQFREKRDIECYERSLKQGNTIKHKIFGKKQEIEYSNEESFKESYQLEPSIHTTSSFN